MTRSKVAEDCKALANALDKAGFKGPNADHLKSLLNRVVANLATPGPNDQPPPKRKSGPPRPQPAGTWNPNRDRTIILGEQKIPAPTIAIGIRNVFQAGFFKNTDESATEIANAVQKAFPENNYKPYRVWADLKKFNNNALPGQGRE